MAFESVEDSGKHQCAEEFTVRTKHGGGHAGDIGIAVPERHHDATGLDVACMRRRLA